MATGDEAQAKAAATYNVAADSYDDPANAFWDRFGRRTIDRLQLLDLTIAEPPFDAVVCVFGIFFVPDVLERSS